MTEARQYMARDPAKSAMEAVLSWITAKYETLKIAVDTVTPESRAKTANMNVFAKPMRRT